MDQFTKDGRKLRPRKTAATSGASFEKVEYSARSEERSFNGEHNDQRRSFGENRSYGERKPYGERSFGERRPRQFGEHKPYGERRSYGDGEHKSYSERNGFSGERSFNNERSFGEHKPYGERKSYGERSFGERRPRQFGEHKPYGERRSYGDGERKSYSERNGFSGERSFNGERKSYGERNFGERKPRTFTENKAYSERNSFNGERSFNSERPFGEQKSYSERNRRPAGFSKGPAKKKSGKKPMISHFGKETYEGISRMIERRPVVNDRESSERYDSPIKNEMRLNKFIANSGVCSRREADTLIQAGVVTVNGEIITELGTKVNIITDDIRFNGERLHGEEKVYIIMNKPKGFVTTASDPHADKTVIDLVKNCPTRVYPVGRLDKNTTGVLMLTNDGEIAERLTHPSYDKKKIYQVALDKELSDEDYKTILEVGVTLTDGIEKADELEYIDANDKRKLGIEIHSGKNRIVRRIFESLGYNVKALDRVYFAGVTKKGLKRGEWRYLTEGESNILKMGAYI